MRLRPWSRRAPRQRIPELLVSSASLSCTQCRILQSLSFMDRLLEATARAERDHFWFRGFRRFIEPLVAAAAGSRRPDILDRGCGTLLNPPSPPPPGSRRPDILDCGCGTGHNLTWLRRYGDAYGIDLTWAGLQYAHSRGDRRVARATASGLPFAAARFGLVTSFDVLYSLPDDVERGAIAEMYR